MTNPYTPPTAAVEVASSDDGADNRGGCLTAFLAVMVVTNLVTGVSAFAMTDTLGVGLPGWVGPALGVGGLFNAVCAVAVWKWRRWGVIGLCVSAVLVFGLNLWIGVSPGSAWTGLLGPVILLALVRPHWGRLR